MRGEILLTGLHIKELEGEFLELKLYIEVNMKNKLPPNMTKKAFV